MMGVALLCGAYCFVCCCAYQVRQPLRCDGAEQQQQLHVLTKAAYIAETLKPPVLDPWSMGSLRYLTAVA